MLDFYPFVLNSKSLQGILHNIFIVNSTSKNMKSSFVILSERKELNTNMRIKYCIAEYLNTQLTGIT